MPFAICLIIQMWKKDIHGIFFKKKKTIIKKIEKITYGNKQMLAPVKLKTYYVFSSVYLPGISLKWIKIYIFEQYVSNSQHQKSPHTKKKIRIKFMVKTMCNHIFTH